MSDRPGFLRRRPDLPAPGTRLRDTKGPRQPPQIASPSWSPASLMCPHVEYPGQAEQCGLLPAGAAMPVLMKQQCGPAFTAVQQSSRALAWGRPLPSQNGKPVSRHSILGLRPVLRAKDEAAQVEQKPTAAVKAPQNPRQARCSVALRLLPVPPKSPRRDPRGAIPGARSQAACRGRCAPFKGSVDVARRTPGAAPAARAAGPGWTELRRHDADHRAGLRGGRRC